MSRPTTFIQHAVSRWRRGKETDRSRFSEAGDTLVEVLLSIVILGIAATALLTGFAVAITSSANHRDLTTLDSSVRNATDAAIAQVQQNQAQAFGSCPNSYASQLDGQSLGELLHHHERLSPVLEQLGRQFRKHEPLHAVRPPAVVVDGLERLERCRPLHRDHEHGHLRPHRPTEQPDPRDAHPAGVAADSDNRDREQPGEPSA